MAFMSRKLKGRIAIVNSGDPPEALEQYIPRASLTPEFGGSWPFDLEAFKADCGGPAGHAPPVRP
jgi:hypothetical protein